MAKSLTSDKLSQVQMVYQAGKAGENNNHSFTRIVKCAGKTFKYRYHIYNSSGSHVTIYMLGNEGWTAIYSNQEFVYPLPSYVSEHAKHVSAKSSIFELFDGFLVSVFC